MKQPIEEATDATMEDVRRAMYGYTPQELARAQKRELVRGMIYGAMIGGGLVAVILGQVMMWHGL